MLPNSNEDYEDERRYKKEEMKQTFSRGLKKFPDTSSSFGKLCTGGVKNDAVVD